MAEFRVFHHVGSDGRMWFEGDPPAVFPKAYDEVAIVEAESVEDAYRLTNNIERSWIENPEVRFLGRSSTGVPDDGARSTSIGDVIVAAGHAFECRSMGWKEIAFNG